MTAAALVGLNPDLTPPSEQFGPFAQTEESLRDLRNLVHHWPALQKAGYVLGPLSQADLDRKRRCERCTKAIRKGHEKQKSKSLQNTALAPVTLPRQPQSTTAESPQRDSSKPSVEDVAGSFQDLKLESKGPPMNCRFHSGVIRQRTWTCCNSHIASRPCTAEQFHTAKKYRPGELEANWRFSCTPAAVPSSPSASTSQHVAAVVLDCEMGCAESGESELIRVSAVDFFTRRVLVDSLVRPDVKMAHYNTRFSGVTRHTMEDAMRRNQCLRGRDAARKALWRFVGPDTVVVGHAVHGDLTSMRWIHDVVVDTLLLEMRIQPRDPEEDKSRDKKDKDSKCTAEPAEEPDGGAPLQEKEEPAEAAAEESPKKPKYPGLSLKALALARLGREIQAKGRGGHDSLEDALATRDILLWHVTNKPLPPLMVAPADDSF